MSSCKYVRTSIVIVVLDVQTQPLYTFPYVTLDYVEFCLLSRWISFNDLLTTIPAGVFEGLSSVVDM